MTHNELFYGDLQDVFNHLHYSNGVTERDARVALTNAIAHIIQLEKRLAILEQKAEQEAA